MREVRSFTDRKGNKVHIGDTVGYFAMNGEMKAHGKVNRITKAGYFISVFTEERKNAWYKTWIEKVEERGTQDEQNSSLAEII